MNNMNIEPEIFMVVEQNLLNQMKRYLDYEITREEYADIAERYYSKNAKELVDTKFDKVFSENVPDACMFYIDEPGGMEEENEKAFYEIISKAFDELNKLAGNIFPDFIFVYGYNKEKKTAFRMYHFKGGLMYRFDPKTNSWEMDAEQMCIFCGEDVFYDEVTEEEARNITVRV